MLSVDAGNVIDNAHTDGTIHWNFRLGPQAFDFLADGETLQLTYTIRATDSDASLPPTTRPWSSLSPAPTTRRLLSPILPGPPAPTSMRSPNSLAPPGTPPPPDTASGSLAFTDLDLTDTHTVDNAFVSAIWSRSPTLPSGLAGTLATALSTSIATDSTGTGTGSVGFIFSATDHNFDFLADGETLTVTYNVTVTDNDLVQSVQPVTITIHGTDDAPVITSGDTASVTEAVSANTVVYTAMASDRRWRYPGLFAGRWR